ncbi:MAG: 30S ribosomal protein S18 [Pirellulales bacterium]|nr:30S ribosomal protein S18 [Pirellulales bacterium]
MAHDGFDRDRDRDRGGFRGDRRGGPGGSSNRIRVRVKKKDPIFINGERPRPMYIDYKDMELLGKLVNRQGKIVSRRKSGCTAISQHAVTKAIKRARFMALLPYVGE